MSKKLGFISQLMGAIYILLSFYFVSSASNDPTPVDEFNIYWMFTLSAMSLGGFLVVTNSENKIIHWGTRGILAFSVLFPAYLVLTKDLGAAFYFPWAFIIVAIITLVKPHILDHKKSVIFIARVFVGSLFIVSGLIKANDPLGFSYKLEDYFTETALGSSSLGPDFWTFFYDWSLFLAIFISAIEVLLGLAVLIGGKAKLTAWTLLSMALFFAWLTWFTATCMDDQKAFGEKHMEGAIKIDEKFNPQLEKIAKDYEGYYEYIGDSDDNFSPEELVIIKEIRAKVAKIDEQKAKEEIKLGEWKRTCVDDCGCFGDAMKGSVGRSLTPWESFYKDICLLFFVIILLLHAGEIKLNSVKEDITILPVSLLIIAMFSGGLFDWMFPFYFAFAAILIYWLLKKYPIKKIGAEWTNAIGLFILCLGFTIYCLWYLPIKDFRPYAIGNNLIEQRTSVQPELKFYYTLKDKKTGEEKEFDHWPENWDQNYDYVSSRNEVIKEGVDAPAKDFSITDISTGLDITDSVLAMENVFIMVAYDLKHADANAMAQANEIAESAKKDGILFICLTASSAKIQDSVIKQLKPNFKFYTADEKVQKTIIRSNPGLLLIQKAVVMDMWPAASFPVYEDVKNDYIK
jgi:uncharacterized membrane protein YphA (DoxX/SURF4 family)